MDDVILMTAAADHRELTTKIQTLAHAQIDRAGRHGAIFDVNKTKWMIFTPQEPPADLSIDFGDRKGLRTVNKTKWLGVTLDSRLTFKKHGDDVVAKGKKEGQLPLKPLQHQMGHPPQPSSEH